jgi:hypothetical protein
MNDAGGVEGPVLSRGSAGNLGAEGLAWAREHQVFRFRIVGAPLVPA